MMNTSPIVRANRVVVVCPGASVTGGPELLHQLVDTLRAFGHAAFIAYYPTTKTFTKPLQYGHYDAPQTNLLDTSDSLVVLPETLTSAVREIKFATIAIWWLSVNNYLGTSRNYAPYNWIGYARALLRRQSPLSVLRRHLHLVQSEYARQFLCEKGITSHLLTDYLGRDHVRPRLDSATRKDVIVFNPKKGGHKIRELSATLPNLHFRPISGLSSSEVAQLLESSKIYVDFGYHPGKDRLPREAAMAGCCIITGLEGAAGNEVDIPILPRYKIGDRPSVNAKVFNQICSDIFTDFSRCSSDFDEYRRKIQHERQQFASQVRSIFGFKAEFESRALDVNAKDGRTEG